MDASLIEEVKQFILKVISEGNLQKTIASKIGIHDSTLCRFIRSNVHSKKLLNQFKRYVLCHEELLGVSCVYLRKYYQHIETDNDDDDEREIIEKEIQYKTFTNDSNIQCIQFKNEENSIVEKKSEEIGNKGDIENIIEEIHSLSLEDKPLVRKILYKHLYEELKKVHENE